MVWKDTNILTRQMPNMSRNELNQSLALEVRDLHHAFGKQVALSGVSFSVSAGEVVAVKGRSGSGKSTLLHLMGGLDTPQQGEVWWHGIRADSLHTTARATLRAGKVGLVFQHHYLLEDLTLLENISVPLMLAKMPHAERAQELLAAVGLANRGKDLPQVLSGGERQRVAIARALACSPAVLLADEPTGSLDRSNAQNVAELMFSLARQVGSAVVLVTHDEELAASAGRTLTLSDGKLLNDL